jgi:hypothetical protein
MDSDLATCGLRIRFRNGHQVTADVLLDTPALPPLRRSRTRAVSLLTSLMLMLVLVL